MTGPAADPPAISGTSRREALLAALFLTLLTTLVFYPCLDNGFVNWDDDVYVINNPSVRSLDPRAAARILTTFRSGNYHPLTLLTYALERRFFGLDPAPYHSVNLLLHAANCLLVLRLLLASGFGLLPSFLAAAVFGVHPLRVESVAWISDRKDLLAGFFSLISLNAYLTWTKKNALASYLASLLSFTLALLSKGTAAVLPLLLFAWDWSRGRRFDRKALTEKIPFLTAAALAAAVAVRARASYEGVLQENLIASWRKLGLGVYRLMNYFIPRLVAPVNLKTLNPFYREGWGSLPPWPHLALSIILLAALAASLVLLARRSREAAFGPLFFLLSISSALPVVVLGHRADRFTYLPSLGIAWLLAAALRKATAPRPGGKLIGVIAAAAAALVIGVYAILSRNGCGVWRSGVTLWEEAVGHYPSVASFHNNLGNALGAEGEDDLALREYTAALNLEPSYVDSWVNRGAAWIRRGDRERAIGDFSRALAIKPDHAGAYNNRGIARAGGGEFDAAIADFTTAARLDPRYADAWYNRANVYAEKGDIARALADLDRAIEADPLMAKAYRTRGALFERTGEPGRARSDRLKALDLGPDDPAPPR